MNKRIVILGDSLSLPRPEDNVKYEDTYMFKLFAQGYEVINRAKRENDTSLQTKNWNLHTDIHIWNPNIVIIFLGIVDCAPRLFTKTENKIISRLPSFIRNRIISFFSKKRRFFTKLRKITYVKPEEFYFNMIKLIDYINKYNANIVLIKIVNVADFLNKNSYGYRKNIEKYNAFLEKVAKEKKINIIDSNNLNVDNKLLSDGYHITSEMHQKLFEELKNILGITDE